MVKILITGANGQLGSAIVVYFNREFPTYELTGTTSSFLKKGDSHLEESTCDPLLEKRIHMIHLDITNTTSLDDIEDILKEQDTVIHTAGYINVHPQTPEETNRLWNVNYSGTCSFFTKCEEAKIKTMIYISSIEAFLSNGVFDINNLNKCDQDSVYGYTKAIATIHFTEKVKIPNKLTIFPSGIISRVHENPAPLMKFIYSIKDSYIQFYPKTNFFFVDGDIVAEKVCSFANICDKYPFLLRNENVIMLGRRWTMYELIDYTKKVMEIDLPVAIAIPDTLLYIASVIGELFGSREINKSVFNILKSTNNLKNDPLSRNPHLVETLANALADEIDLK